MLSRFYLIPERNGQTDGHTVLLRVSMLARNKNHRIFMKFCTQQQIFNWMNVT